jgi:chromosome segregation ATPase
MGLSLSEQMNAGPGEPVEEERYQAPQEVIDLRAEVASLEAKLTASQTAGRDQASEIDDLRARLSDANATIARADESRRTYLADLDRERATVRDLLRGNDALETTVDVLARMLAAKGQS